MSTVQLPPSFRCWHCLSKRLSGWSSGGSLVASAASRAGLLVGMADLAVGMAGLAVGRVAGGILGAGISHTMLMLGADDMTLETINKTLDLSTLAVRHQLVSLFGEEGHSLISFGRSHGLVGSGGADLDVCSSVDLVSAAARSVCGLARCRGGTLALGLRAGGHADLGRSILNGWHLVRGTRAVRDISQCL